MSFSAGGANTSGVQAREQGVLKAYTANSAFSIAGGETLYVTHTVPANKIWILKNANVAPGAFVGTISSQILNIYLNPIYVPLISQAGNIIFNTPQQITLKAGEAVAFRFTTTAWTSGQVAGNILVQEIDA
jgi:hypothetical protein